jgi:HSP20 family protein
MAFDVRGDLLRDIFALREAMDRLVRGSFERLMDEPQSGDRGDFPVDIAEGETGYIVFAALPGVTADHLDIQARGNTLAIRGERQPDNGQRWLVREQATAHISRTIALPEEVNAEFASATLADGVLTVTLPKKPAAQPVRIPIAGQVTADDMQDSFSADLLAVEDEASRGEDVAEPAAEAEEFASIEAAEAVDAAEIDTDEGEGSQAETGEDEAIEAEPEETADEAIEADDSEALAEPSDAASDLAGTETLSTYAIDAPAVVGEEVSAIAETPFRAASVEGDPDRVLADSTADSIFVDVITFVDSATGDAGDDEPATALDSDAALAESSAAGSEDTTESAQLSGDDAAESDLGLDTPVAGSAATIGDVALEPADGDIAADVATSFTFVGSSAPALVEEEAPGSDDTEIDAPIEKAS